MRDQNYQLTLEQISETKFQESIAISIENEMSYLEKLKSYLTKITDHCSKLINDIFFNHKPIEAIQEQ